MIRSHSFVVSYKLFIITCIIVYFNSFLQEQWQESALNPLIIFAEAGSKSSKSAKTTVIAIDGGGGGKAHPVPVPWPVVHCHHHHHHLKYVPKPVLIHHWVKKEKVYDFAASEHKPLQGEPTSLAHLIDNLPPEHLTDFGPSQSMIEQNRVMLPPHELQQTSNKILNFDSIFNDPSNQFGSRSYPKQLHSNLPIKFSAIQEMMNRSQLDRELKRRLHSRLVNDKQLQQRLNTLQNNKSSQDPYSEDTLNSISLANSTNNAQQSNGSTQSIYESSSNNQGFILDQSQGAMSAKMILPGRPSHPFDESHQGDQIRDESQHPFNAQSGEAQLSNDLKLLASLNQKEETQAASLFEKLAFERAKKVMALTQFNQPIQLPNQFPLPVQIHPNQALPTLFPVTHMNQLQRQQKQTNLFNPAIRARMASSLSESETINAITRMAEEAAKLEARKMLIRKRQPLQKEKSPFSDSKELSKNSSFLTKLSTTIKNYSQRDKRRMETKQFPESMPKVFDLSGMKFMYRNSPETGFPSPQQHNHIKMLNLRPPLQSLQNKNDVVYGSASTKNIVALPKPSLPVEQMSAQSSTPINRVADLKEKEIPVRVAGAAESQENRHNTINNNNNTMSLEQESGFYNLQRDHLTKQRSVINQAQKQIMINNSEPDLRTLSNRTSSPMEIRHQNGNFITGSILESNKQLEPTETVYSPATNSYLPSEYQNQAYPGSRTTPQDNGPENLVYGSQENHQNSPQQTMMGSGQEQYQPDVSMEGSYLEFPISPQQWSSEAIKSINNERQSNEKPNVLSSGISNGEMDGAQLESNNQQQQEQEMEHLYATNDGSQYMYNNFFQEQSPKPIHPLQSTNLIESQIHIPMETPNSGFQNNMPVQLFPNYNPYSRLTQGSYYHPRYVYPSSGSFQANYMNMPSHSPSFYSMNPSAVAQASNQQLHSNQMQTSSSEIDGTEQLINRIVPSQVQSFIPSMSGAGSTMNQIPAAPADFNNLGPSSVTQNQAQNNLDTLESAKNEMSTLRQFQSSLGQTAAMGARNFSSMTNLAGNLRSLNFGQNGGQRGLPQIPNIPQPPQAPNIPMPPPGMMQTMAGIALPLAMARATRNSRIRNQQVNAAANGGGTASTSAGQRFLQSATSFTNRLMNRRRKPSPKPNSQSSFNVRPAEQEQS